MKVPFLLKEAPEIQNETKDLHCSLGLLLPRLAASLSLQNIILLPSSRISVSTSAGGAADTEGPGD